MKTKLPFDAEIEIRSEGTLRLAAIDEIPIYDYQAHGFVASNIREHLNFRNWMFWAER